MKHLRKFDSVADLNAAIANSTIGMIGLAYNNGNPVINNVPEPILDLPTITIVDSGSTPNSYNFVLETTNATLVEYTIGDYEDTEPSTEWIQYTERVLTGLSRLTVFARATNNVGTVYIEPAHIYMQK